MPDNLKITRPMDAYRINLSQEHEVRYWTQQLGVSKEKLIAAVEAVGDSAAKVRGWFAIHGRN